MKLLSVIRKSLIEQWRDKMTLVLMLSSAPFFVVLYWAFLGGGSTTYTVLVLNQDVGLVVEGQPWNAGAEISAALRGVTYADGQPMLDVRFVDDRAAAEHKLSERDADLLLVIPAGFSQGLRDRSAEVTVVGDLTNPYYAVASVLAGAGVDGYIETMTGSPRPVSFREEALGASATRTEFETYVPGLLIFAVIMLVFPVAMTVAHEVEAKTLRRLQLTRVTSFDFLAGLSAAQVLVGVAAVLLTFLTAIALGFRSQGPVGVAILVAMVTGLSVVGVGLLVACAARTVTQAFVIANFPLMLMMFFSGAVFPMPRTVLFHIGGRGISLNEALPTTHAVAALNKVLTLGVGLKDVTYELAAVLTLSLLYFAAGIWLFQHRHLHRQW
jgi:ABC-2 type transport system permease protein